MSSQEKANVSQKGWKSLLFGSIALALLVLSFLINSVFQDVWFLYRVVGIILLLGASGFFFFFGTTLGQSIVELFRGSLFEMRKVTWPTRSEVIQTSIMVFVFVIFSGLFLWFVDWVFLLIIRFLLG